MLLFSYSAMSDSETPGTVAYQAPLSRNSPGKSTGVGCHAVLQGNLPNPGIEPTSPTSPTLAGRFFTTVPAGKLQYTCENLAYLYMHLVILAHTSPPHQNLFSAPRRSSLRPPVITMVELAEQLPQKAL